MYKNKSDNPLAIVGNSIKKGLTQSIALPLGAFSAIVPAMGSKDIHRRLAGQVMFVGVITSPIWVTTLMIVNLFKRD